MSNWKDIRALCRQLRVSEEMALNEMQSNGAYVISDLCVTVEDIADADVPSALSFLKARFGPDQPELI